MEELQHVVTEILEREFPGSVLEWIEDSEAERPGGLLIWPEFEGIAQIDRQRQLANVLNAALGPRKYDLGVVFAFTPEELNAVREAA